MDSPRTRVSGPEPGAGPYIGREIIVFNWIITEFIAVIVFALLCLVVIGIPLLIALGLAALIFPIIGGIKASNGEAWPYPGSLKFF